MFEYSFAEYAAQSENQPLLLRLWLNWLLLINVIPALLFIKHVQARWILAAFVVMMALGMPLGLTFGFSKVLAIPHLVVWIPLLIYLGQQWRGDHLYDTPIFKGWIALVIATNLTSLVFDVRDTVGFALGDRAPIKASMSDIPYWTFAAVAIALAALYYYLRRPRAN